MNEPVNNFYEFDCFQVDVRRRLLMREGQPIAVTPKAFEILLAFVRSGGRVMTKDEMMNTVWPDCFVEEGNLAQNIFLLRRTLGERKNEHKFIITIPGVGYRFAPYVMESAAGPAQRRVAVRADQKIGCIAVLPLKPACQSEMHPSLGVGFADALINRLSKLRIVKVLPTATMLRVVQRTEKPSISHSDFDADALLAGLYQRDGEHLRISIQLILAGAGTMLWAQEFDAQFTNLFQLQDALSEQVANALGERLKGLGQRRLSVVRTRKKASLRRCS
jgi:DNA-binding winged helix-turn-helix (wHTH) protein